MYLIFGESVLNWKSLTTKHFRSVVAIKITWNENSTVNWIAESEESRQAYSTEILLNTAMIITRLNRNWLKVYGERNTGFPAITAPRLQTIKQISWNFKENSQILVHGGFQSARWKIQVNFYISCKKSISTPDIHKMSSIWLRPNQRPWLSLHQMMCFSQWQLPSATDKQANIC